MAGLSSRHVRSPDSRRSEETLYLSARRNPRLVNARRTGLRDATSRGRIRPRSGAPARIDTRCWLVGARELAGSSLQDRSKSIPSFDVWECYLDQGRRLIPSSSFGMIYLPRDSRRRWISASKNHRTDVLSASCRARKLEKGRKRER